MLQLFCYGCNVHSHQSYQISWPLWPRGRWLGHCSLSLYLSPSLSQVVQKDRWRDRQTDTGTYMALFGESLPHLVLCLTHFHAVPYNGAASVWGGCSPGQDHVAEAGVWGIWFPWQLSWHVCEQKTKEVICHIVKPVWSNPYVILCYLTLL